MVLWGSVVRYMVDSGFVMFLSVLGSSEEEIVATMIVWKLLCFGSFLGFDVLFGEGF